MKGELEVTYIFETIERIADKIGLTAKELWPYFVKQEIMQSIITLIACAVTCIISLYVRKTYGAKFSEWEGANEIQKPLSIIPLIALVVFSSVAMVHINHLLNPEFFAFKEFMSILKK